jgi:hypothetical protein
MVKFRQKLQSTKLKMLESGRWVTGNSSALMQTVSKTVDVSTTTGAASFSARNAAIDIAHAAEDYACSDYTCLALDSMATGCDVVAGACAFIPGSTKIFAVTTSVSCFCRTLRNKCKSMKGGIFGCN